MNKFISFIIILFFLNVNISACDMPVYISKFVINKIIQSPPPVKPDFKLVKIIRAVRADPCKFGIGKIELNLNP